MRRYFRDLLRLAGWNNKYEIGEMYCGPGGIAIGADLAKVKIKNRTYQFDHRWATDYHPDTCATYQKNVCKTHPKCRVVQSDIKLLNIEKLPIVDGFLYGFPCNDFSSVGETKGLDGTFGPLYSYGVRYINFANPRFIFAENVSGFSSANEGAAFSRILRELANAGKHGYRLTTHLYKFEQYGIPQARHRFIIVGIRRDLNRVFKVPKPSGVFRTAREALESPVIPIEACNQEATRQSKTVVERLQHIKPGQNAWTANLPEHLKLNVKGAKMSMIYKRLDPDKPAYTVTGSGGGGTHVYHWSEPRALTNRERARLQTFPDDFEFVGSKESVRRQIGMAVPVEGARIILEAVLKTLQEQPYESIEASHPNIDLFQDY